MKKHIVILLCCLLAFSVSGCSSENDQDQSADEQVQSTGQKIATEIKKPIDKANLAKELTEEHNQKIDENLPSD